MARDRFTHGLLFGAGVAALVVAGWLFVKLIGLFVLVFLAVIVASGLAPMVRWVERVHFGERHLPRAVVIALPLLFTVILMAGFGLLMVQMVSRESHDFGLRWPEYETRFRGWLQAMSARYAWLPNEQQLMEWLQQSLGKVTELTAAGMNAVFGVLGGVASSVLVVFIAFNLLLTRETITDAMLEMLPEAYRTDARSLLHRMSQQLGGWMRAQVILALVMGGLAWVALTILGVKYAFLLAVLVGLGEFIPMLGPIISGGVAALVAALTGSVNQALLVIILFLAMQGVENYLLAPRLMRSEVGLHPLVTVLSFLAGGMLLGLVGALLAVPIVAALSVPFHKLLLPALWRRDEKDEKSKEE